VPSGVIGGAAGALAGTTATPKPPTTPPSPGDLAAKSPLPGKPGLAVTVTEDMYRFPLLDVKLGDQSLSTSPPQFIKDVTVRMLDYGSAEIDVTLFDETWITIPTLLQRAAEYKEKGLGSQMTVTFGWDMIPGQLFENLQCAIHTIGFDVSPDGILYKLVGQFDLAVNAIKTPSPLGPMQGTLSTVAQEVINRMFGAEVQSIIEESEGPNQEWNIDLRFPFQWLNYSAKGIGPANPHTSRTSELDAAQLNQYAAYFDIYGIFHFHTPGYLLNGKPLISVLRYPYPTENTPIISMSFAEWTWSSEALAAQKATVNSISARAKVKGYYVDDITGDHLTIEGTPGGSESAPKVSTDPKSEDPSAKDQVPIIALTVPHRTQGEFVRHANYVQQLIAMETTKADVVLMGDINYAIGNVVRIEVTPPSFEGQEAVAFLSGLYVVEGITHSVSADGFTTGLAVTRDYSGAGVGTTLTVGSGDSSSDASGSGLEESGSDGSDPKADKEIPIKTMPMSATMDANKDAITKATGAKKNMLAQGHDKRIKECADKDEHWNKVVNSGATIDGKAITKGQWYSIVAGVMTTESNGGGNPEVIGSPGKKNPDYGVMQINKTWGTSKEDGGWDARNGAGDWDAGGWKDPDKNVCYGVFILADAFSEQKRHFPAQERLQAAIATYNRGGKGVRQLYNAPLGEIVKGTKKDGTVYDIGKGMGQNIDNIDFATTGSYTRDSLMHASWFGEHGLE